MLAFPSNFAITQQTLRAPAITQHHKHTLEPSELTETMRLLFRSLPSTANCIWDLLNLGIYYAPNSCLFSNENLLHFLNNLYSILTAHRLPAILLNIAKHMLSQIVGGMFDNCRHLQMPWTDKTAGFGYPSQLTISCEKCQFGRIRQMTIQEVYF